MNVFFALLRNPAFLILAITFGALVYYYNVLVKAKTQLEEARTKADKLIMEHSERMLQEGTPSLNTQAPIVTEGIDDYNDIARTYNYRLEAFPSGLLAGILNFPKADYLTHPSFL